MGANKKIKKYIKRQKEKKRKKINIFWYKTFTLIFHYLFVGIGTMYLVFVNFFVIDTKSGFMPWAVFFTLGILVIRLLIATKKYNIHYLQRKMEFDREKWKYRSITIWYILLTCIFVIAVVLSLQFNSINTVKLYSFLFQIILILFMGSLIISDEKKLKK